MRFRIIKIHGWFEPQMQLIATLMWVSIDQTVYITIEAAQERIRAYKQNLIGYYNPEIVWEGE